ncbi:MAG: hypothetical protein HY326_10345 [Chloroflexi bacterium]|nr:hypothetical protein [Chloroflexota bacterium]
MPSSFFVTTPAETIELDADRRAEISFAVSNASGRRSRGRARVTTPNFTAGHWLSLDGEAEREFRVGDTNVYSVRIAVPPDAPAGNYTFRLDVIGVDNPDEDFTAGPFVAFDVPAPVPIIKPFPWWIVAVVVAVIIVVGGIFALLSNQNAARQAVATATAQVAATQTAVAAADFATQTAVAAANAATQTAIAVASAATQTALAQTAVANSTATARAIATQTSVAQESAATQTAVALAARATATAQAVAAQTAQAVAATRAAQTATAVRQAQLTATAAAKVYNYVVSMSNIDANAYLYVNGVERIHIQNGRSGSASLNPWLANGDNDIKILLDNSNCFTSRGDFLLYRDGLVIWSNNFSHGFWSTCGQQYEADFVINNKTGAWRLVKEDNTAYP